VLRLDRAARGVRLYAIDPESGTEIGRSEPLRGIYDRARLTLSGDRRTLYITDGVTSSTPMFIRLDITTDNPQVVAQTPVPGPPSALPTSFGIATNQAVACCSLRWGGCGLVT
jgi:hypothetical protein